MTMNCNAAPEDEPRLARYGGRREPLAICYNCGREVAERSLNDGTCGADECRPRAVRRPVDPWLVEGGER